MERTEKRQSSFNITMTPENMDGYLNLFVSQIAPEGLIGAQEQRDDLIRTVELFKNDIRSQLSDIYANDMIHRLDEEIATRHYHEVKVALDEGTVTEDLISAIREVPVKFSPVQKNMDLLRERAIQDQRTARTASEGKKQALRDRAERSAKVAVSYAADTVVVKKGPIVLSGEQYTLQKLSEAKKQLPKNDTARHDVDAVVSNAYGQNFILKEPSGGVEVVRKAAASVVTAAILSTLSHTAAYAGETKISQVIPNETDKNKAINDAKGTVNIPLSVKHMAPNPDTKETPSTDIAIPESVPPVAEKRIDSKVVKDESAEPSKQKNADMAVPGDLVFKIPRSTANETQSKAMTDDLDLYRPNTPAGSEQPKGGTSKDKLLIEENRTVQKDADVVSDDSRPSATNEESTSAIPATIEADTTSGSGLSNTVTEIRETAPNVQIKDILDEPKMAFKIPKDRTKLNDRPRIEIVLGEVDDEDTLRFSLKKDQKRTGVKPVELPDGLKIIPIPTVPIPAPEAPAPPAPEQAPTPASDFSQAAQKLIERGGLWERRGIAMKFLIDDPDLAMTPSQAAGVVGNLLGESGPEMNPGQSQFGGPAFGIVQWEGGRLMDLGAFAGKNQADFMTQLQFMKYEFLGKERVAFDAIKATTNRKDAAFIMRKMYERPSVHRDEERHAFAIEVGDAFNKEYQAILASRIPAAPETQPNGILAGWPSSGQEAMKLFNQCDPSWGEIKTPLGIRACEVSCGPTSVAMAVNALTGRPVNPGEVIKFTNENKMWLPGDKGTSFDGVINLGKNFGINGYQMQNIKDINTYKEVLQNGGMILVAGTGPVPFVAAPDAHFVLIRGMTTDGKFLVADPYPKTPDTNTKSWDANQIINGTFGAVVFTK